MIRPAVFRRALVISLLFAGLTAIPVRILSQGPVSEFARALTITSPRQAFGAAVGDDYFLASYTQLEQYWHTLAQESDRLRLIDIGATTEGRRQWMAVVTSRENQVALDRYREISRRLARADGVDDARAAALAAEGKAIVWIGAGLHADEVLGAQQLIELVYRLVSNSDAETLRILRETIVLVVPANPDGQELVTRWYMRRADPLRRSLEGLPRLYQPYAGHDINRDFYMASQAETININRVLYREWYPQVVFDHHQPAPRGTVMFAPPFADTPHDRFDPLLPASIDAFGAAIQARFAAENKAGVTMRGGSAYTTWWNGGLRTTAYFHNQVGLLTETFGDPTPTRIPHVAERQQASADLPRPIAPQPWHFRRALEYTMTANYAVLDYASSHREQLLLNAFRMARNNIARGREASSRSTEGDTPVDPDERHPGDPRAYVLSAAQRDFPTAVRFVDALVKNGVDVLRATAPFNAGGRTYPAGSFIVDTAQAFRPHVLDMFEPQEYAAAGPGANPAAPYDVAGWTLAYQMGVVVDRVHEALQGVFEPVAAATVPPGAVAGASRAAGYLFGHDQNNAFVVLNRLLAVGEHVYWVASPGFARARIRGVPNGLGNRDGGRAMYVSAGADTLPRLRKAAVDLGVSFVGVAEPPAGPAWEIRPVRIGLWDQYGGSSASGWTRWILEQFEFPVDRVFVQQIDAGNLATRYDVIVLPDDAVPSGRSRREDGTDIADMSPEYRATTGTLTWERSVARLREFVDAGGTLLLVGGSTAIAPRLGVAVRDGLTAVGSSGERPLTRAEFDIPGSVLRARVNTSSPLAYGLDAYVDLFFNNSPLFRVPPFRPGGAAVRPPAVRAGGGVPERRRAPSVNRVAWFDSASPLRSGWAQGQERLRGLAAVIDAAVGGGRVLLFGPEVTFRSQSHGTFKFLFNGIYYGKAAPLARVPARGRRP